MAIIILIGGFFYFKYFPVIERYIGMNDNTQDEVKVDLPEGVSVVERDGERFVRDERNGVEIKVEDKIEVVSHDDSLLFYNQNIVDVPAYTYRVVDNEQRLSIEEWLEELNREEWLMYYSEREKIWAENMMGYKIKNEGALEHFSYYFAFDDKIFIISTAESEKYEDIAKTFKIIKGGYENKN